MKTNFWQKLITIFWKQNKWHKHWVLVHTLRVTYYIIKNKKYRMIAAWLLHDIWKPVSSTIKDKEKMEFSFIWHEEKSYQIIKNWPFISEYTKKLVRWHYLIRWTKKAYEKSIDQTKDKKYREHWKAEHIRQKKVWDSLSDSFKKELSLFLKYDDLWKWNTSKN